MRRYALDYGSTSMPAPCGQRRPDPQRACRRRDGGGAVQARGVSETKYMAGNLCAARSRPRCAVSPSCDWLSGPRPRARLVRDGRQRRRRRRPRSARGDRASTAPSGSLPSPPPPLAGEEPKILLPAFRGGDYAKVCTWWRGATKCSNETDSALSPLPAFAGGGKNYSRQGSEVRGSWAQADPHPPCACSTGAGPSPAMRERGLTKIQCTLAKLQYNHADVGLFQLRRCPCGSRRNRSRAQRASVGWRARSE